MQGVPVLETFVANVVITYVVVVVVVVVIYVRGNTRTRMIGRICERA